MADKLDMQALEEFTNDNTELEWLEEITQDFNIFAALRIENNEIRHSNFLAWLMNPNESHGLGDYFLASFLKTVASRASSAMVDIDSWDLDSAEILREWRHIDIFIKSDEHRFICLIENKIRSKEHDKQLQRYREVVENEYPDYAKLFVYLTVDGGIPSDGNYIQLSHSEIASLIEDLMESKRDRMETETATFISHYRNMLRRYTMENTEVQDLCRKIYRCHRKALDLIFEYKPDKQLDVHDCLVQMIQEDPDLILDDSNKSYIRFISKDLDFLPKECHGWTKSKRVLLLVIANESKGIVLSSYIGTGPEDIRMRLHDIVRRNLNFFNAARNNRYLGKNWSTIYKKPWLRTKEYEEKNVDEIRRLLEKRLAKFKEGDLPKMVEIIGRSFPKNGAN